LGKDVKLLENANYDTFLFLAVFDDVQLELWIQWKNCSMRLVDYACNETERFQAPGITSRHCPADTSAKTVS